MELFKTKWGQWTDLSTGAIHETRYLLQARRHKDGRVKFRVEKSDSAWACEKPTIDQLKEVVFKPKLEQRDELLEALISCKNSMSSHPDFEPNSEFEDFVNKAEKVIEKVLKQKQ